MPADDRHWYPRVLDGDLLAFWPAHFILQTKSSRCPCAHSTGSMTMNLTQVTSPLTSIMHPDGSGDSLAPLAMPASPVARAVRAWPAAAAAAHALIACPPRAGSIASRAAMAGLVTAWQPATVPERVGPMGELRASEHRYGRHNARRHRRRRVLGLLWLLLEWGSTGRLRLRCPQRRPRCCPRPPHCHHP